MKKLMTLALLGGLFAATTLQAQVNIYLVGSTAFRASAWRAVTNLYGSGLTGQNPGGVAANNSGTSIVTLTGTMSALGGQTVNVFMSWNGSAQGVHNLTHNDNISFLTNDFSGDTAQTNMLVHTPDVSFSDVFQITTPYNTPTLGDTNGAVLPYRWVRSAGAPTTIPTLTSQQYHASVANGFHELSYFTGNSADDASDVFFCGRNSDSGSRLTAFADSGATGTPAVYSIVGGNWTFMNTDTIANGVDYGPGFSSGGTEAGTTGLTGTGANGFAVGYEGYADARTVVAGNGQIIAYNGAFPFNGWSAAANGGTLPTFPDFTPIFKGQYSFWSYEHMFMRSGLSGNVPTFYGALASKVDVDLANVEANNSASLPVIGIRLSEMKVHRTADGGPITP